MKTLEPSRDKSFHFPFLNFVQVPIQVKKDLAYSDGMRVIESAKLSMRASSSDGLLFTELDR